MKKVGATLPLMVTESIGHQGIHISSSSNLWKFCLTIKCVFFKGSECAALWCCRQNIVANIIFLSLGYEMLHTNNKIHDKTFRADTEQIILNWNLYSLRVVENSI